MDDLFTAPEGLITPNRPPPQPASRLSLFLSCVCLFDCVVAPTALAMVSHNVHTALHALPILLGVYKMYTSRRQLLVRGSAALVALFGAHSPVLRIFAIFVLLVDPDTLRCVHRTLTRPTAPVFHRRRRD